MHIFRVFDNEPNAIQLLILHPNVQYFFSPIPLSKHYQIKFVEKNPSNVFSSPPNLPGFKILSLVFEAPIIWAPPAFQIHPSLFPLLLYTPCYCFCCYYHLEHTRVLLHLHPFQIRFFLLTLLALCMYLSSAIYHILFYASGIFGYQFYLPYYTTRACKTGTMTY